MNPLLILKFIFKILKCRDQCSQGTYTIDYFHVKCLQTNNYFEIKTFPAITEKFHLYPCLRKHKYKAPSKICSMIPKI